MRYALEGVYGELSIGNHSADVKYCPGQVPEGAQAQALGTDQEAAQGQEGGSIWGEAGACQDALARHDHRA